ncbi:phage major capsid protein [Accumulibacter sp.]|jgi:HK97 family phage major capsid protein|uniref:phage major capsid protein n=1 Tax=Accumulibacter sp. TaxID=2053492 RepID=UPI001ACBEFCD|nr:phage major capsid protein [Accumulibacter sp.]MBN8452209.1 phage major capsid protein [Accumulibacter sp.]MBO3708264.1 phage major capsid protein [Candidatus Accumulibacter conexus]
MDRTLPGRLPIAAQIIDHNCQELRMLGRIAGPTGERVAADLIGAGRALGDGDAVQAQFWRELGERQANERARGLDAVLMTAGVEQREAESGWSLGRLIRSLFDGGHSQAPFERDLDAHVARRTGSIANGAWAPLGLLLNAGYRDFNVGTSTEAGNLVANERRYGPDPLRAASNLVDLGASVITGLRAELSLPEFVSTTAASWLGELGTATTITETTRSRLLSPKRCAVKIVASRQAILQAPEALDLVLAKQFIEALFAQLEVGALNGTGSGNEPLGVRNTTNIGSVAGGTDGALLTYAHLCDLEKAPLASNAPMADRSGFLVNPNTWRYLRTLAKGSGLPFVLGDDRRVLGHRTKPTTAMPANLTKGASGAVCSSLTYAADWQQLTLGIFGGGVDVTVDRFTKADIGAVVIAAQMYCSCAALRPASFATMDDAKLA